jgi:carbon monoxide dehydrogenase subunit G
MTKQPQPNDPTIESDAPVVSSREIEIDAPIDHVWGVLTAIERWPTWNPDVKSVSIDDPVAEGVTFRWKAGPGTITSRVEHFERPRLVAWSGRTLGIRAIHVWRLETRNGKTVARTEESYDGLVARVLRRSLQKTLDTALTDGAGYLKAEAEKAS